MVISQMVTVNYTHSLTLAVYQLRRTLQPADLQLETGNFYYAGLANLLEYFNVLYRMNKEIYNQGWLKKIDKFPTLIPVYITKWCNNESFLGESGSGAIVRDSQKELWCFYHIEVVAYLKIIKSFQRGNILLTYFKRCYTLWLEGNVKSYICKNVDVNTTIS